MCWLPSAPRPGLARTDRGAGPLVPFATNVFPASAWPVSQPDPCPSARNLGDPGPECPRRVAAAACTRRPQSPPVEVTCGPRGLAEAMDGAGVRAEVRRLPPRESCVPESGKGQVGQRGRGKGSPCLAALQDVAGEGPPARDAGGPRSRERPSALQPSGRGRWSQGSSWPTVGLSLGPASHF